MATKISHFNFYLPTHTLWVDLWWKQQSIRNWDCKNPDYLKILENDYQGV